MSCEYAQLDGSYVLGALSPGERRAFEEHLSGCDACARSVRELAGLPGLLARVDAAVLAPGADDEPVPDTLLPALLRQVDRRQRRRTLTTAGLAAAAAVAAVVGSLSITGALPDVGPPASVPAAVSPGRSMQPVGVQPVSAAVAFEEVAWGTRLHVTCSYDPQDRYRPDGGVATPRPAAYALVVHTRDGGTQQVATWRSLPGETMRLTAVTAAARAQIVSVEVRTAEGRPVLRLRT